MTDQPPSPHQVDSATALKVRKQPQPGDVLDGIYRLDQQLGKGGVGVVYKAFHLHLQRPCAIKFMHPQLVSNPELRTRFRREAQSAFQLGHPNIVAITDFRDDPNSWPYLAMELVIGETLRDRLERGPLEPRLALRMMVELCDALNAAHRRGVIHRDLKPENLFLVRVDSPGPGELETTLKVLDFGLSKLLDGVEITGTGRLLGSPSYMSPEQARGDSHLVDARSDIFAVGALLYECLVGEKMFSTERFEQKRQQIMAAKLPPLQFGERGIPAVDGIIARACSRKPEDRYQTAAALKDALEDAERQLVRRAAVSAMPLLVSSMGQDLGLQPTLPAGTPGILSLPSPGPLGMGSTISADRTSAASSVGGGEIITGKPAAKPRRTGAALVAVSAGLAAAAITTFTGYAWLKHTRPPIQTVQNGETTDGRGPAPRPPGNDTAPTIAPTPQPVANNTVGSVDKTPVPTPTVPPSPPAPVVVSTLGSEGTPQAAAPSTDSGRPARSLDKLPPIRDAEPVAEPTGDTAVAATAPAAAAPAAKPVAPAGARLWKKGRGPGRAIATGPVPAAPTSSKAGGALNDSATTVNGVMRRALPAVLRCYPTDTSPPTKIAVDLTIQSDGRVAEANLDGADDGAACVLQVIRSLRFPAPTDGDSYGFRYDFVNLRR